MDTKSDIYTEYALSDLRYLAIQGLIDKPILNTLSILIPSTVIYIIFGMDSLPYIISLVLALLFTLIVFQIYFGYYLYKNSKGLVPVKISIENEIIRITYGSDDNDRLSSIVIKKISVRKIWQKHKIIIIERSIFFGLGILLSNDKLNNFISTLKTNEWPIELK